MAEGVEDDAVLQALAALGCTTAQGYHVTRPLPPAELVTWLAVHDATRDVCAVQQPPARPVPVPHPR